ncbi:MAG: hypothetical protein KKI08_20720 [Armatimonadetes bacterium]|nr:hypothetical protein [Armatimonadota bacterium]
MADKPKKSAAKKSIGKKQTLEPPTTVVKTYLYRAPDSTLIPASGAAAAAVGSYKKTEFRTMYVETLDIVKSDYEGPGNVTHDKVPTDAFLTIWDLTGTKPLPTVASWLEPWDPLEDVGVLV